MRFVLTALSFLIAVILFGWAFWIGPEWLRLTTIGALLIGFGNLLLETE